jgi:hypothetical protein
MRKASTLVGLTLFALATTARAQDAAPPADTAAPPAGETAGKTEAASENGKAEKADKAEKSDKLAKPAADAPAAEPVVASKAEEPKTPGRRKWQVGAAFLPMGMGEMKYSITPVEKVKTDALFAYGFGIAVNYEVMPHLSVGLAPQMILNVKEKGSKEAAFRQFDLLARVAYSLSITDNSTVYVELLPGYSLSDNAAKAKGFLLAGGLGVCMDLSDRVYINLGAGYQMGFQTWKQKSFTKENKPNTNIYESSTRFVRVALGGGVRF